MIIAISNQKGGVGKSTTAQALTAWLTKAGKKTLLIDLDPQINTSVTVGANIGDETPDIYDILTNDATAAEAIQEVNGVEIIPGSRHLTGMDTILAAETGREKRLKKALLPITRKYDAILIDTPPALSVLTVNALTAATGVIITACPEAYGLQGISQLNATLAAVKEHTNPKLWIMGILLTRCRKIRVMQDIEEPAAKIAKSMGTALYKTRIRESAALKEAQVFKKFIFDYAPNSIGAEDYANFSKELLQQMKKGHK